MERRYRLVRRLLSSAVVIVLAAGCDDGQPSATEPPLTQPPVTQLPAASDPDCPYADASKRVTLAATGNPAPDISRLFMCTSVAGLTTLITNNTNDVWVVQAPPRAVVMQKGEVPGTVRVFRLFLTPGTIAGFLLEPGTARTVGAAPAQVTLKIDSAVQSQWSTFTILDRTVTAARERLSDLIKNPKYQNAVKSCLDAGARMVNAPAASTYDTKTLIAQLGLATGVTRCAADLAQAEHERQTIAQLRAGHAISELEPGTFAKQASSMASEFDDLLKVAGQLAHVS